MFASEFSQQQKKGRESSSKRVDTQQSDKEFYCEEEDQTVKEISYRSDKEIFVYAEDKKLNWQIHVENQRQ